MKQNFLKVSSVAMLSFGLFLAVPGAFSQMQGGPPSGGQPGGMQQPGGVRQPGASQDNSNGMQQPGAMNSQNNAEMNFIANARRNSKVETDLSKLALKNSSNDGVKNFAQQVIKDNHRNEMALTSATASKANSSQLSFGEEVPSQTRKAEKQMKKLTGSQFDQMYLSQMDGYVMNDQKITSDASSTINSSDLASFSMQLRNSADDRAKQITQIAQSENFKIGAPQ